MLSSNPDYNPPIDNDFHDSSLSSSDLDMDSTDYNANDSHFHDSSSSSSNLDMSSTDNAYTDCIIESPPTILPYNNNATNTIMHNPSPPFLSSSSSSFNNL